jgi:hypothetical protein
MSWTHGKDLRSQTEDHHLPTFGGPGDQARAASRSSLIDGNGSTLGNRLRQPGDSANRILLLGRSENSSVLPLPAPAKQTQRAEIKLQTEVKNTLPIGRIQESKTPIETHTPLIRYFIDDIDPGQTMPGIQFARCFWVFLPH